MQLLQHEWQSALTQQTALQLAVQAVDKRIMSRGVFICLHFFASSFVPEVSDCDYGV